VFRLRIAARVAGARVQLQQTKVRGVVIRIEVKSAMEVGGGLRVALIRNTDLADLRKNTGLVGLEGEGELQLGGGCVEVAFLAGDAAEIEVRLGSGPRLRGGLLQPGYGGFVVFCAEAGFAEREQPVRILRTQRVILLQIRKGLRRIFRIGDNGAESASP
jgi:hypothetical protein